MVCKRLKINSVRTHAKSIYNQLIFSKLQKEDFSIIFFHFLKNRQKTVSLYFFNCKFIFSYYFTTDIQTVRLIDLFSFLNFSRYIHLIRLQIDRNKRGKGLLLAEVNPIYN
nr:MAG TPA: hypothetical protein [Caudoviricetes sp.]